MSSIGSLFLDLFVRERDVDRSLNRLPQMLERIGSRVTRIANTLGLQVGFEIGSRIVDGLTQFSRASIATGADFEKAMSGVKAITDATGGAMASLRAQALDLSKTTAYSATEIAGAMEQLGAAGFSTRQIMAALPATLRLAEAGSVGIAEAAQIAAAAMNNLAIPAEEVSRVADVLAKASAESATDVHQLGEAFKFVAPIGRQFGKGLEDIVAPLEVLANAGLRAEMSGTGLRQVFSDLSGEDREANKLLRQLGININKIKLLPLADQVDALNLAFKGTGDVEKAGEILKAFGQRSGPTLAALLNQGGDALRKMEIGLRNANGEAQRIANTRLDNVAGGWQRALHSFQEVLINAFDQIRPQLRAALDWMSVQFQQFGARVPAIMSGIVEWVKEAIPVATQIFHTLWAELKAIGEIGREVGSSLQGALGWLFGGSTTNFRETLAVTESIFSTWKDRLDLFVTEAWLGILELWNDVTHILTVNVPEAFQFVLDNWRSILDDMGALAETFFNNLLDNLENLITKLPELVSGKLSFDRLWTPLLNGLPTRKTPDFVPSARRQTEQENALATSAASLMDRITQRTQDIFEQRLGRMSEAVASLTAELKAMASGAEGVAPTFRSLGQQILGSVEFAFSKAASTFNVAGAMSGNAAPDKAAKATMTGLQEGWAAVQKSVFVGEKPAVKIAKDQLAVQKRIEGHQKGLRNDIMKLAGVGGMVP